MTFEIRPVRPEEYDTVGELTVAAYRALEVDHLWGGYDDDIRDVSGRVAGAHVLVAADGDAVLGAVTYVDDPDSKWLEWTQPGEVQFRLLAVDVNTRGRGVGEALARECMRRAQEGGHPLIIHTTQWMPAARRLYDRLGFTRRVDRDVPYEIWNDRDYDLPEIWVGEPFLAYTFSG